MKLSQILAKEKKLVPTNDQGLTEIQLLVHKKSFFEGSHKEYIPLKVETVDGKERETETFPPETVRVQQRLGELIIRASNLWTDIFDMTFSKDKANMEAKANVVVNDVIIVKDAPVSWLLWADKRLQQIRTFFDTLPTLSEEHKWEKDTESGLWKTQPIRTHRTKKSTVPLVLYPHQGDKLPAQVTTLQEDITVGHYEKQNFSSAISTERKRKILDKIDLLIYAVKQARAEANSMEAEELKISKPLFDYILAD